ncbi:hypothetical protein WJX81_005395 [Elliptochloris bilobata]|uniref:Uncharacterized protein n=1 Tax=Elliptochloris bilobata TaxID=381761 RepID=A0AAW1SHS1_9CHLO
MNADVLSLDDESEENWLVATPTSEHSSSVFSVMSEEREARAAASAKAQKRPSRLEVPGTTPRTSVEWREGGGPPPEPPTDPPEGPLAELERGWVGALDESAHLEPDGAQRPGGEAMVASAEGAVAGDDKGAAAEGGAKTCEPAAEGTQPPPKRAAAKCACCAFM